MSKQSLLILCIISFILSITACEYFEPSLIEEDQLLDGPIEGLNTAQTLEFHTGDVAFNDEVFTRETGLGPLFVTTSCGSCHAGDGKGVPFTSLTRFGQSAPGINTFLQLGGPQLQHRALPGYLPEQIPAGASFAVFTPPAVTGLGYLELVADEDILAMSDPMDLDGDGISGVPNWIELAAYLNAFDHARPKNNKYIHRFGKKASAYNLLHQTANAYNQDMGINSIFEARDVYSGNLIDPEISEKTIHSVVFYLQTLKAPIQRNPTHPEVIKGEALFFKIGCESCHKKTLVTSYSAVGPLSNIEFHPYTDLLLHDMGSALDDGYTEGSAETFEWRTAPLWGLGLTPKSQGGKYFLLHDGRANSIEEAILYHGGEAQESKEKFIQLSTEDKQALILFIKSL